MQVAILAGGLGTRLRPLTLTVPKPMVPIHGRPFLEYQIEWVKQFGFHRILLLTGYLGEQIEEHFQDGRRWGVSIAYSRESSPLGTAGALKLAEHQLDERFLLLNGDTYLPIDYGAMARHFEQSDGLGLMTVYDNADKVAMNNVGLTHDGKVARYAKSGGPGLTHVVAGAYLFKSAVAERIPAGTKSSLEEDLVATLAPSGELGSYPVSQRFYDIGTFERFALAEPILGRPSGSPCCSG